MLEDQEEELRKKLVQGKNRKEKAYELRTKSRMFLSESPSKKEGRGWWTAIECKKSRSKR